MGFGKAKLTAHKDSDMTEGSIWKQLIAFSIPMAIGLLFQQLYNTVDTLVVGRFVGKEALAAVGSTGNVINMFVGFCAGMSTGASVMISQSYGSHDSDRLVKSVHTTLTVTLIMCVVATAGAMLLLNPLLRFMKMPADVWDEAHTYLQIYIAGFSGLLLYNMGSSILKAVGDSTRPLYFLIFSALLNTVLDLVFVVVFHLGVAGVAYATIIAQALSAVLTLVTLTREKAEYGIRWNKLGIDREMLHGIMSVGLPSGIQQAVTGFSNVFVQSYINNFGSACMAGYSSYNKLDQFVLIPVQSIALASTTFVGQNWGADKRGRAKDGVNKALIMSLIATVFLSVMMLIFAKPLVGFFNKDADVVEYGVKFINMVTPFYFTICFNQIYGGALRGIGSANVPTIIMLSSFVVFRQIYLAITKALGMGFNAVALAYPVGWILCSTLLIIFYRRSELGMAEIH